MKDRDGVIKDKCHVPPFAGLQFTVATKHEGSFYTMQDVRTEYWRTEYCRAKQYTAHDAIRTRAHVCGTQMVAQMTTEQM